ncbi:Uu.00g147100.m01.CDS01 [Anthostomella pinea]|uniref:Uu.00g147100.m01.CDS01 n=1 Tax=Anthostomella pinea TaxID=933095 RepID=A0AAI8VS11_9PEZI|nr:Uu.00g147100.m01.CDS01 [Anthostomella pinea]
MQAFSIIAAAALVLSTTTMAGLVPRGGGFYASCGAPLRGGEAGTVTFLCPNDEGKTIQSILNVNQCIGNQNGQLVLQAGGGFVAGCKWGQCAIGAFDSDRGYVNTALNCAECGDGQGNWVQSAIDLNDFVVNRNGLTMCFDVVSEKA